MIFDTRRHLRFVALSCDRNPIHVDAIAARRTQPGALIVHGIHSLLELLQFMVESDARQPPIPRRLRANFRKPVYIDDSSIAEITQETAKSLRARLVIEGTEAVVASLSADEPPGLSMPVMPDSPTIPLEATTEPNDPSLSEIASCKGSLSFENTIEQVKVTFPAAATYLGSRQVAALVCCSRLVGMVVPGLHSLFVGLDVSFSNHAASSGNLLQFSVTSVDPRFRLVQIAIRGGGLAGHLEAVSLAPPVRQPSMLALRHLLPMNEFRGTTALVVGGSRGLGELTSKIIATGGGKVVLTYATGEADARRVTAEISGTGASCEMIRYDARHGAREQLTALETVPSHVYYFATPPINRRKAGLFDLQRFSELNAVYIAGFLDLIQACLRRNPTGVTAFYPSSIFVDSRPADMTEYAMSKAAAEILCADIQQYLPRVRVVTRRLPRLLTDQTNALLQPKTEDSTHVMLSAIREINSNQRETGVISATVPSIN